MASTVSATRTANADLSPGANNQTNPSTANDVSDDAQISQRGLLNNDKVSFLFDSDWARQAFLISDQELGGAGTYDTVNRYWSTAHTKFTDTRLGGNIGINPRPQFTPYADIPVPGRLPDSTRVTLDNKNIDGTLGMGRYYSEAIDDNAQTIYLRFGVPQFNSLVDFFLKAFDTNMTAIARTGRGPSEWYNIGKIAGTIASVVAFPAISMTLLAGKALSTFFSRPTSKFYTLKPTMHSYWSAVNMLVNHIAINRGIVPQYLDNSGSQQQGNPYKLDSDFMQKMHSMMPEIFSADGGIDVFAVANRAQRMANRQFLNDYQSFDNGSYTDFTGYIQKSTDPVVKSPQGEHTLLNFIKAVGKLSYYTAESAQTRLEMTPKVDPTTGQASNQNSASFSEFFDAEYNDGSQFAIFKVDNTGSVNESFSNSAVESDLSSKYNSTSSQVREAKFSFADGNIVGETVQQVLGDVTDVVAGAASGMTMGLSDVLKYLGNTFVDIPKHWQSSSASLPRTSYTMQLISPYGNPISQMQNIYIPLAMLLAAVLPLSTGKQSYTSPFLVQLYDRGRCQIQLGLMESLSITRGTANLPFTNRGRVTAIDVSFSIMDLSSIMHMPISTGSLFGANMLMDEDNILMDYLAVLAGQDIYSQVYALPKAKLRLAKSITNLNYLTSPAYWASYIHEETTTGMLSYLFPISPVIKAFSTPSALLGRN